MRLSHRPNLQPRARQVPYLCGVSQRQQPHPCILALHLLLYTSTAAMAALSAATCTDQSDERLMQAVRSWGRLDVTTYSCAQAQKEGGCALPVADVLCPVTCDLCSMFSCDTAFSCGVLCISSQCLLTVEEPEAAQLDHRALRQVFLMRGP